MKCVALSIKGVQCRRTAIGAFSYHGDGELYTSGYDGYGAATWVAAPFCVIHATGTETHQQSMKRMREETRKHERNRKIATNRGS